MTGMNYLTDFMIGAKKFTNNISFYRGATTQKQLTL